MKNASSTLIHPTAVVAGDAILGDEVTIGPYCVIGPGVRIGDGTYLGPSCLVEGPSTIGPGNHFYGHVSVGTDPQDLKFDKSDDTFLEIGQGNRFREFVTINRGTMGGGTKTTIGNNNLFMTGVHIAHDCHVADNVIMANAATLAGHVDVFDHATVGAFTGVHQFCRVGPHAFVGGYSVVTMDAAPFLKTVGSRSEIKTYGVNSIGLERKGFSKEQIESLRHAYRLVFRKRIQLPEATELLREAGDLTPEVRELLDFCGSSKRGFIR